MNVDTLIHARWIIPVEPGNTVYENYSIAIKDDKIEGILPTDDAKKKFTATNEHNLNQHAIIPGLDQRTYPCSNDPITWSSR